MIQFSSSFYSTMVVHRILNDDPHMMNHKDRAWKFKRNCIGFHMLDSRSLNDNHAFNVVHKDWAWKFKRITIQAYQCYVLHCTKKFRLYEKEKHFNLKTPLASLPRLVMLLLNGYSLKVQVSSTICLLRSSPNLQNLRIHASVGANEAIGVVNYMEAEAPISYSPSLERMVIENRSEIDAKEGLRISTELMQFPRASTKAQIVYLP
ncbi:hypothetical protein LguiB_001703 [Lonicera macranthoides]